MTFPRRLGHTPQRALTAELLMSAAAEQHTHTHTRTVLDLGFSQFARRAACSILQLSLLARNFYVSQERDGLGGRAYK